MRRMLALVASSNMYGTPGPKGMWGVVYGVNPFLTSPFAQANVSVNTATVGLEACARYSNQPNYSCVGSNAATTSQIAVSTSRNWTCSTTDVAYGSGDYTYNGITYFINGNVYPCR